MCGISGLYNLNAAAKPVAQREVEVMMDLIAHRGPDAAGAWVSQDRRCGLGHRRLAIIDLTPSGAQPMHGANGTAIVYNGEIYNYPELKSELSSGWEFHTASDTETILAGYEAWGVDCVDHLRGMFAFALLDQRDGSLFCARDRLGIKPFYYAVVDGRFLFASEIKALLPFLPAVEIDRRGLQQYLTFQFTIGETTLFKGVSQLAPGHRLTIRNGEISVSKYWDVVYEADVYHTPKYFKDRLVDLMDDSIRLHLRSDVPVGSYLSGGVDSTLIAIMASKHDEAHANAFHGRFTDYPGYDESSYARAAAEASGKQLYDISITARDFTDNIEKVIYHLDQPAAGPGSFPQYMVSQLAAKHNKVVLGGQGGDEIFAGYARYLVAYFEQCLKAAIDGTYRDGHFIVTAETIIPNLESLREYKPMLTSFWKDGLFESHDRRYFRLINRFADLAGEISPEFLDQSQAMADFGAIFNNTDNVHNRAYLDQMLHFDSKTLLPALLHVEDRMSMAHGLESRVPFLDHPVIEFLATVPASVKFQNGKLKNMLKDVFSDVLPPVITKRRDKMGFPVPLSEWYRNDIADFVSDLFGSQAARERSLFMPNVLAQAAGKEQKFSRKTWGLMSLELWFRAFADRGAEYRALLNKPASQPESRP